MDIDGILAEDDRPIQEVPTPEWKKCPKVYVRSLSAYEALSLEQYGEKGPQEKVATQLSAYLCDEKGQRVVSAEKAKKLLDKSVTVVMRIIDAGNKLNGKDDSEQETIKGKS